MQPGLDRADWGLGNPGNLLQRELFDEMQQQHGAVGQRQLVQQLDERILLLSADEQLLRPGLEVREVFIRRINGHLRWPLLAPMLDALLVRNVEEPRAELLVPLQGADVPGGVDEALLDDIQARLLLMDQLVNIGVKRQPIACEQRLPGRRFSGPGFAYWQLQLFSHYRHLHPVECKRSQKVQWI